MCTVANWYISFGNLLEFGENHTFVELKFTHRENDVDLSGRAENPLRKMRRFKIKLSEPVAFFFSQKQRTKIPQKQAMMVIISSSSSSFCRIHVFFFVVWFCGSFHVSPRARFHRVPPTSTFLLQHSNGGSSSSSDYTAVMIVPTGIGASIGGYAGDALPAARLLSCVVDRLITHPNVLNGAMMYWPMSNVLYVEGYALDEFAAGRLALQPLQHGGQRIGLLLDKGMEEDLVQRHLQVVMVTRSATTHTRYTRLHA